MPNCRIPINCAFPWPPSRGGSTDGRRRTITCCGRPYLPGFSPPLTCQGHMETAQSHWSFSSLITRTAGRRGHALAEGLPARFRLGDLEIGPGSDSRRKRLCDRESTGIQKAGQKRVVYWYQSGSRVIASEYTAKAQLFADAVFRGRTSGALVRIVIPDEPGSSELAVSFASRLLPELTRCWGE